MRCIKGKKGFTLIEIIIVVAIIAILAAILAPIIANHIADARTTRASADCKVLAAAVTMFYKDVGRWPDSDGTANLPVAIECLTVDSTAANYPTDVVADPWLSDTEDTFSAQLMANTPGTDGTPGGTTYTAYDSTAKIGWRGPYVSNTSLDPWGKSYLCNISTALMAYACEVISAGSNTALETNRRLGLGTTGPGTTDIWYRIK